MMGRVENMLVRGCIVISAVLILLPAPVRGGEKRFVGLAVSSVNWESDSNWTPIGAPTLADTAVIGWASPYVAITGTHCTAHTVIIENGGRLVIRKSDAGDTLTVARDFIVEKGGVFNTAGTPAGTGPLVFIGGNVVNDGIWDLAGVSSNGGSRGVVFNGVGTQTISGTAPLTFHNLTNSPNDSLIISGTNVGVVGKLDPQSGALIVLSEGGSIVIGSRPLTVLLVSFSALRETDILAVTLQWSTSTEYSNSGFYVERREAGEVAFDSLAFVPSLGSGVQTLTYSLRDTTVRPGTWEYRLRAVDTLGHQMLFTPASVTVEPLTGVADWAQPARFALDQNFPNPFNPETRIRFSVESAGRACVTVYNLVGQAVATLFEGEARPGISYTVAFSGRDLPSGVYFYRLEAGGMQGTRRMILLR